MSVIVTGMKMPADGTKYRVVEDPAGRKFLVEDDRLFERWFLLRPLPEKHGRLGDLDALRDVQQSDADFFAGSSDYGEKVRYDEALNAVANILNAPTIVEAEGD